MGIAKKTIVILTFTTLSFTNFIFASPYEESNSSLFRSAPMEISNEFSDKSLKEITDDLNLSYPPSDIRIVIGKIEHTFIVYSGETPLKFYRTALSYRGFDDKEKNGDYLTPEGVFYFVTRNDNEAMLKDSIKNNKLHFYSFSGFNYPTPEDGLRAYKQGLIKDYPIKVTTKDGIHNQTIKAIDILRKIIEATKKRKTGGAWESSGLWKLAQIGGDIGIHGDPIEKTPSEPFASDEQGGTNFSRSTRLDKDWTIGCVYLPNSDMDELVRITPRNIWAHTPILIVKSLEEIIFGDLKERFKEFLVDPDPFIDRGTLKDLEDIPPELENLFNNQNSDR